MGDPEGVRMGVTTLHIRNRTDPNMTGTAFAKKIKDILGDTLTLSQPELARRSAQVEELVYQQFNMGNIPDFMRPENFSTLSVRKTIDGRTIEATLRVCPDYLAIGTNSDYILVPLSAPVAQRIATRFNLALPTHKLVDVIDEEAKRTGSYINFVAAPTLAQNVINPHTQKPAVEGELGKRWNYQKYGFYEGRWMLSGEFVEEQNKQYKGSRNDSGIPLAFRSGHKKDVIYDQLNFHEAQEGGQPVVIYHGGIQGLSNWHTHTYLDYSHGIRFIDNNVTLTITERDGSKHTETRSYTDLLKDPKLYQLISHGPIDTSQLYRGIQIPLVPRPKPVKKDQPQLVQ